jgi:hypothetical protein
MEGVRVGGGGVGGDEMVAVMAERWSCGSAEADGQRAAVMRWT